MGAGTRISSNVSSKSRDQELSVTIHKDVQHLQGMGDLSDSLFSLAEIVLHRGLDLLFLQQGELCAALKEGCFYVEKTGMVKESMRKVREGLEKRQRERERER